MFYSNYIYTALSRVISELFNVEKCRDVEIQRSLKVIEPRRIDPPPMTFY